MTAFTWLPESFVVPTRLDLPTGHHLRPIRASDVDLDMPAVMGSRERLWVKYGEAWGWPPVDMSHEADREDLARHEREIAARESFNFAIFDADETKLLGCVYLDPVAPDPAGPAVELSWWVVDDEVGGALEAELDVAVPAWVDERWPFARVDRPFG